MSSMAPLISRDAARFDPIFGDTRYRVPPRLRNARKRGIAGGETAGAASDWRQFLTAFTGGFLFFSILIF